MTVGLDSNQTNPDVTVNQMVLGHATKDVAGSSDVTLSDYEATWSILEATGVLTGNINVIYPQVDNNVIFINSTTGSYTVTVKMTTGTGIVVTQGAADLLYTDATNVYSVTQALAAPTGLIMGGDLDLNGNALVIDTDGDTKLVESADDVIDIQVGGSSVAKIDANGFHLTVAGKGFHGLDASGTDVAGSDVVLSSGQGTGTGAGGNILFQTAPVGSTGSTNNALTTQLTINDDGDVYPGAGASSMTGGFMFIPTGNGDPGTPTNTPSGTVPLYYNYSTQELQIYDTNTSVWVVIGTGPT